MALLAALGFGAAAQAQPQARVINCEGPFGQTASHDDLLRAFGPDNVVAQVIYGAEGEELKASIIYPKNPKARLEVIWNDEAARRGPTIRVRNQSAWATPNGIRLGAPLADIEKRNGKAFKLAGFGWDYGGRVTDWQGGALGKPQAGGCLVGVTFSYAKNAPQRSVGKVSGDKEFLSSSPDMRAVKPYVEETTISYAQP